MESLRTLLEQQPLMALFLTIAIGFLAGEINIKGLSLGVGAVLFVALAMGWFAPAAAPSPTLGNFGLALFLYAVGVQYGRHFFTGLTSAKGLQANLLALAGVLLALGVSLLLRQVMGLELGHALGLFAGSTTSTPSLQAAMTALGSDAPAVGYSVAYPFGVAGPIVFLYLAFVALHPRIEVPLGSRMELIEIGLKHREFFGKRVGDLVSALPPQVQIVAVRRGDYNQPASLNSVIAENDVLLAVGPTRAVLDQAQTMLGEAARGHITSDRRDLDYLRVFASRPAVVGRSLGALTLPGEKPSIVAHVLRGDGDLQAKPDVVLEYGDRVGILANRADFPALRRFFGDSIKGTAEFSYISIGLGMALGLLLGAVGVPVPGVGTITLGLSGVLIVALVLGSVRRTAGLNWTIPMSANLVLRNLGLTLFLAQVGIASGPRFATTVTDNGLLMLGLGVVVLMALVLPPLVLGLFVFRMPYDEVAGIVAGACGNPAILAYASRLAPTDATDIGYAMIFPGMTVVKILLVTIVAALAS
jgi:putative transport protein